MILVAGLASIGSGCGGLTSTVWKAADEAECHTPIAWALWDAPATAGGRQLVVRYDTGYSTHFYVTVSVDSDGRPKLPFSVETSRSDRSWEAAVAGIDPAQRAELAGHVFELHDADWELARHAERTYDPPGWKLHRETWFATTGISGVAFRYASEIRTGEGFATTQPATRPAVIIPADAFVLLMPAMIPRPKADMEAAKRKAVLLSPLTVPFDAVLVPFSYLFMSK